MGELTVYWAQHYATDHCTLCGNHGVIDSRGVRTPAGLFVGRLNYCICPNGQAMREEQVDIEAYAAAHMPQTLIHFGTPGARFAITEVPGE